MAEKVNSIERIGVATVSSTNSEGDCPEGVNPTSGGKQAAFSEKATDVTNRNSKINELRHEDRSCESALELGLMDVDECSQGATLGSQLDLALHISPTSFHGSLNTSTDSSKEQSASAEEEGKGQSSSESSPEKENRDAPGPGGGLKVKFVRVKRNNRKEYLLKWLEKEKKTENILSLKDTNAQDGNIKYAKTEDIDEKKVLVRKGNKKEQGQKRKISVTSKETILSAAIPGESFSVKKIKLVHMGNCTDLQIETTPGTRDRLTITTQTIQVQNANMSSITVMAKSAHQTSSVDTISSQMAHIQSINESPAGDVCSGISPRMSQTRMSVQQSKSLHSMQHIGSCQQSVKHYQLQPVSTLSGSKTEAQLYLATPGSPNSGGTVLQPVTVVQATSTLAIGTQMHNMPPLDTQACSPSKGPSFLLKPERLGEAQHEDGVIEIKPIEDRQAETSHPEFLQNIVGSPLPLESERVVTSSTGAEPAEEDTESSSSDCCSGSSTPVCSCESLWGDSSSAPSECESPTGETTDTATEVGSDWSFDLDDKEEYVQYDGRLFPEQSRCYYGSTSDSSLDSYEMPRKREAPLECAVKHGRQMMPREKGSGDGPAP